MLFCRADFDRGAGLGTRLFPWSRCVIYSTVTGTPMLAPQWVQPRIGPLVRGGIDFKAYHRQILLMGLFQARAPEVSGARKYAALMRGQRLGEPQDFADPSPVARSKEHTGIVTFQGASDMFGRLGTHRQLLMAQLREMTRPRWRRFADELGSIPIGINVRLGNDFKVAQTSEDYFTRGFLKTPLGWFARTLTAIRTYVGRPVEAIVVSDGDVQSLAPLLALGNIRFLRPGCAISDLLVLANTKVFLGAGGSSFSAWASFLGGMPTVSIPGQSLAWFQLGNDRGAYIGDFDPEEPKSEFLQQARSALVVGASSCAAHQGRQDMEIP